VKTSMYMCTVKACVSRFFLLEVQRIIVMHIIVYCQVADVYFFNVLEEVDWDAACAKLT
jgi:hypothetical protein